MSAKRAAERDITIPAIVDRVRRSDLESDDCKWLRHYLPSVFTFEFSEDQRRSVEEVGHCLRYGVKKCIAGPRGDGKTSITRYLLLKYMLTGECPFGLYVGSSDGKSDQSQRSIKRQLQLGAREKDKVFSATTPLGEDYPFECSVASYVCRAPSRANNVTTSGGWRIHTQWAGDQLILPSIEAGEADVEKCQKQWMIAPGKLGAILLSCGVTGSMLQGANVFDTRPTFVVLDDLDKRESLAVEEGKVAPKVEEIIEKTISGMKGQGERMGQVMLCTVTSRNSVAFRYSDPHIKPSWSGVRVKRLKTMPDREDMWDNYISLRQKGMQEKDDEGNTKDKFGRVAHDYLVENYDEMHAGAVVGNENIHDMTLAPDGSPLQMSSLQWCYDFIADNSEEAFKTEYQQQPPEEEGVSRLVLSAYHVQHNCRSGLPQNVVPSGTAGLACGMDIKKTGFHFVVWAFNAAPTSAVCIEYNFHETKYAGDYLRVEDAERAILNGLHEWREAKEETPYVDIDGEEHAIALTLIDQGWKHESWASQPVDHFCMEAGLDRYYPCKGWGGGQYRMPDPNNSRIVGDNWNIRFAKGKVPHINWNSDHWKMKVHEGFLTPPGEPGSLALFTPSAAKSGRRQQPHMSFAKHITSHVWEERFVPGYRGMVCKWWFDGANDHYLDASSQGLVAASILGATTLTNSTIQQPEQVANTPQNEQTIIHQPHHSNQRSW